MKKGKWMLLLGLLAAGVLCAGCRGPQEEKQPKAAIPYGEGQLYAVAHLGYQQPEKLEQFQEKYLEEPPPIHYVSPGDYYLVIPRYEDMDLVLFQNHMESTEPEKRYEEADCRPFVIQCNVSDIFPDALIRLSRDGETAEFSPFISLKDGEVLVGEKGLLLEE